MTLLRLAHHGTGDILAQFNVKNGSSSSRRRPRSLHNGSGLSISLRDNEAEIAKETAAIAAVVATARNAKGNGLGSGIRDRAVEYSPWEAARLPGRAQLGGNAGRPVDFLKVACSWDRGSRSVRERILEDFIATCKHKTGPQLERELSLGASLFLTRISAWLRLTYLLQYNLELQMDAIGIFLSASGGGRYLSEFLEIGGALTLLEMISLLQVKEKDKASALKLLIHVASAGRRHKEFLCECQAVRAVSDCLARSKFDLTQDYARHLLQELGAGNPKYLMSVYKALLALLTSPASLVAQQMAGQALRALFPSIPNIHPSIVEATLSLLKSPQLPLQHEAYELLRELIPRENLQDTIINALVDVLQIPIDEGDTDDAGAASGAGGGTSGGMLRNGRRVGKLKMVALYIQQAYTARLLGYFSLSYF
ncbi:hypothetical protein BC828DRAFT_387989 [Blastocladiella britannica]|nr:hypothetical protein BC828DRAFT_387989 [Blastocladiella britannica]